MNPEIAEIDAAGNITAKAIGTATIVIQADDKVAECKVTVVNDKIYYAIGAVGLALVFIAAAVTVKKKKNGEKNK